MRIEGDYIFDAPQQMVWDAVRDPDVLGQILPGGEGIHEVGENEYEGNLNMKVGPVNGKFKGNIKLLNINPPDSYDIEVDGKGAPGFVKATGNLKLEGQGEQTKIEYAGDAKVGGRIASVGQRLLDTSAKAIVRQSLELLNEYLKAQVAAQSVVNAASTSEEEQAAGSQTAAAEVPKYQPPSQTKLAANLAKDVAGEIIPPQYRPLIIGAVVLLIIILLIVIF